MYVSGILQSIQLNMASNDCSVRILSKINLHVIKNNELTQFESISDSKIKLIHIEGRHISLLALHWSFVQLDYVMLIFTITCQNFQQTNLIQKMFITLTKRWLIDHRTFNLIKFTLQFIGSIDSRLHGGTLVMQDIVGPAMNDHLYYLILI